jgi:hypothetical protein
MSGGAWPFLVGGVICLVDSDNERDLNLLNRKFDGGNLGEGVIVLRLRFLSISLDPFSIILAFLPLDVLGCTRATLTEAESLSLANRSG